MRAVLVLALLAGAAPARADEWPTPTTTYVKSDSGRYRAVVVPGDKKPATVTLYDDKDEVHPQRLFQRRLVNPVAPVKVLVADGGQLVTVDDWFKAGFRHVLVIYDRKGKVVVDCALEQILLPDEMPQVEESKSSRWWMAKQEPVWLEGGAVLIKSAWDAVLRFDLTTGAQTRDGQRVLVNGSDRCRAKKK